MKLMFLGWTYNSEEFTKMATNAELRATFVKSVVSLLVKYNLDGLGEEVKSFTLTQESK